MTNTKNTNREDNGCIPPDNSRIFRRTGGSTDFPRSGTAGSADAERELQAALRALGFRRAQVSYQLTAGIAMLVVNGYPYGRYDFARHTFVD